MARRVYFSFHYDNDISRANVVRNSWVTREREAAGFFDSSLWETVKRQGDAAINRAINRGLENTSVTCVLIGLQTADRDWVQYEIQRSHDRGNGLLGVFIHGIKDLRGNTSPKGDNPFSRLLYTDRNGMRKLMSALYPTYDWVADNGYARIGDWIEQAASRAGR